MQTLFRRDNAAHKSKRLTKPLSYFMGGCLVVCLAVVALATAQSANEGASGLLRIPSNVSSRQRLGGVRTPVATYSKSSRSKNALSV